MAATPPSSAPPTNHAPSVPHIPPSFTSSSSSTTSPPLPLSPHSIQDSSPSAPSFTATSPLAEKPFLRPCPLCYCHKIDDSLCDYRIYPYPVMHSEDLKDCKKGRREKKEGCAACFGFLEESSSE